MQSRVDVNHSGAIDSLARCQMRALKERRPDPNCTPQHYSTQPSGLHPDATLCSDFIVTHFCDGERRQPVSRRHLRDFITRSLP